MKRKTIKRTQSYNPIKSFMQEVISRDLSIAF